MLEINQLNLSINQTPILHDISFSVPKGKILGVVGESGSGKSLTALSAMQLLPQGSLASGTIRLNGQELLNRDDQHMQNIRGNDIAMIFQEPMSALNPVHTIGDQICEGILLHKGGSKQQASAQAHALLQRVGLPVEKYPPSRYPHQLSGGQRQRVMIAMACALSPDFLIADEPTTALDVTLQAQILTLLRELVEEQNMGLLLISHDLAVIAEMSDEIVIMRHGKTVDQGPTTALLKQLKHPYTKQLAKASSHQPIHHLPPILSHQEEAKHTVPLLQVKGLQRDYPTPRKSLLHPSPPFQAVDNVSFNLYAGQSVGLVGESGCGKSTLARMLLALDHITAGSVIFQESEINSQKPYGPAMQHLRRNMQVVFQDPFASFNPRHKVSKLITEPLYLEPKLSPIDKRQRALDALHEVGMDETALNKYAHEFSGGQRQRLAIARALITRPALIIADEPVSALDVSIRAQVLDLLAELRERLKLTYLFISHDLGVVRAICDEVLVMEQGRLVEQGPVDQVFEKPQSSAAKRLVEATPNLEQALAKRLQQDKQNKTIGADNDR